MPPRCSAIAHGLVFEQLLEAFREARSEVLWEQDANPLITPSEVIASEVPEWEGRWQGSLAFPWRPISSPQRRIGSTSCRWPTVEGW
jgi:hypothetical protein